jgi:hypothetical protein
MLRRIDRRGGVGACSAGPDLVHQDARFRRHVPAHATEQHERTHRRADGLWRIACALLARCVGRQHRGLADGDRHVEAAEGAAERQAGGDGAARRFEHHHLAGEIAASRERLEVAGGLRHDRALGRHPLLACAAAFVGRAFLHPCEGHAAGLLRRRIELRRSAALLAAKGAGTECQDDERCGDAQARRKGRPRQRH